MKKKTKKSKRRTDNIRVKAFDAMEQIIELTNAFCLDHLNEEYNELCEDLAWEAFEEGLPLEKGRPASWASGIVHALGFVNFLQDPMLSPHMTSAQVAEGFGVSQGTMMAKSKIIRVSLDLLPLDPEWCIPEMLKDNPLVWLLEVNGFIMDIRTAPREAQEEAYRLGLIPYIPADEHEPQQQSDTDTKILQFPSGQNDTCEQESAQSQKDNGSNLFEGLEG